MEYEIFYVMRQYVFSLKGFVSLLAYQFMYNVYITAIVPVYFEY